MGAVESNAGDDFHLWWAARGVLQLIDHNSRLRVLVMEGVLNVDGNDDEFEAADVTLYFGGEAFEEAERVDVEQLKYSTRHPERAWTASRLCETKQRRANASGQPTGHRRSVLRDLADVYKRFAQDHRRDTILRTLRIRLVSNQPKDEALDRAVAAASAIVRERPGPTGAAQLLKEMSAQDAAILQQLWNDLKGHLPSEMFDAFLAVLDLSDCGAFERFDLESHVRSRTSELTPERAPQSSQDLYALVRRHALPEGRDQNGIRLPDVLAALGVGSLAELYPCPPRLTAVSDLLPSNNIGRLTEAVLQTPGGVVLAHGQAGVGKTVTMSRLEEHLPPSSVVVTYDCFGAGSYLDSGEERHGTRRFVTQVVNELAQRCGTPLLVRPQEDESELWRRLSTTLSRASTSRAGRLVLVVDAVDNAEYAANRRKDSCFLQDLMTLPLPEQVSVVLTARTHRRPRLDGIAVREIELQGFDPVASAQHLRRFIPDASEAQQAQFHNLSCGNPRTQYYTLQRAAELGWRADEILDACRATPDALFDDIVKSALEVCPPHSGGVHWLALMAALSRPVGLAVLAEALGVAVAAVRDFAAGLHPGVHLEHDSIAFRDEDFENYVLDRLQPSDLASAHGRLADVFLPRHREEAEAATHVVEHLFSAGRADEAIELVLDCPTPLAIPDGFRRQEVRERRLDVALKAVAESASMRTGIQLLMRAARDASSRRTLAALAGDEPDLVAQYSDPRKLADHYLGQDNQPWLAPAHMRAAAALARSPETRALARIHLADAEAWLRRRANSAKDDVRNWDVSPDTLARAIHAVYFLDGPHAAHQELQRWRPVSFVFKVTVELARLVAPAMETTEVEHYLDELHTHPYFQAPFLAFLNPHQQAPSAQRLNAAVQAVLRRPAGQPAPWQYLLCEKAFRFGDRTLARTLMNHLQTPLPDWRGSYLDPFGAEVAGIRLRGLAAVLDGSAFDSETQLPPHLRPTPGEGRTGDDTAYRRQEWQRQVGPLLSLSYLRAQVLVGETPPDAEALINQQLDDWQEKASHRWYRPDFRFRAWATLAADVLLEIGANPARVDDLADAGVQVLRDGSPWLWLDLAGILTARGCDSWQAENLCQRAAAYPQAHAMSPRERLELVTAAAKQAALASRELGAAIFDRAQLLADDVDDTAAELLAVHARLALRARPQLEAKQRATIARQLLEAAEYASLHVSEDSGVPYDRLLAAAGYLHPSTAITTASRWDDEDRTRLDTTVPVVILATVRAGELSVPDGLHFLPMIPEYSERLSTTLQLLDLLPRDANRISLARGQLRETLSWLRGYVPPHAQRSMAQTVMEWAEANGILDASLRQALATVLELPEPSVDERSRSWNDREAVDPAVMDLLARPERRTIAQLKADIESIDRSRVGIREQTRFMTEVAQRCPWSGRIEALRTVADIVTTRSSYESWAYLEALADLVEKWKDHQPTAEWIQHNLVRVLESCIPGLGLAPSPESVLTWLHRFGLTDAQLHAALFGAAIKQRRNLRPQQLRELCEILAELLDAKAAAAALVRMLTEVESGTVTSTFPTELPTDTPDLISGLLWSVFGHYRKDLRWRAAHTARSILTDGNSSIAPLVTNGLIKCLSSESAGAFRTPDLRFYWMSARVWLLIALQGAAAAKPSRLAEHFRAFEQTALDRDFPHIQVRELARNIAGLLAPHTAIQGTPGLFLTNQPTSCHLERNLGTADERDREPAEVRYSFDSMDTIPYWFAPLARVFDIPVRRIEELAEAWIVDRWNLSKEDWWNDPRELRSEDNQGRMMHRHGGIPREENLHLYMEYHALMLAAGELLDARRPIRYAPYDDAEDPWQYWFATHLPGQMTTWRADLRSAIPAEPRLFGPYPPIDEWLEPRTEEFDGFLGLDSKQLQTKRVLVSSHVSIRVPGGYGTCHVDSALVRPTHAVALQRALSAASNPTDWKLPEEGESQFEVQHHNFQLRGWMREYWRNEESLDDLDPFATGISWATQMPGEVFQSWASITAQGPSNQYLDRDRRPVVWVERWSILTPHVRYRSTFGTDEGHRTYVDRQALLEYLSERDMNLILTMQIGRIRNERSGSESYRLPISRIYLVDKSGAVTSC
ncbi:ATP-binding protein [Glycomyces sp. NPDC047369]